MAKRKKSTPRRVRRSPYERSLEHATNRLEKALTEQMRHQACLEALNKEIPYLQTVIRALTPNDETEIGVYAPRHTHSAATTDLRTNESQASFLKRFVKPTPVTTDKPTEGIVTDQSEPFIPDIIPGNEILP